MSDVNRPGPKPGYKQSPEHAAKRMVSARFWTPERLWEVMGYVDAGHTDARIGARMGVSADAIRIVRKRNGIRAARYGYLSARQIARTLGIDEHPVCNWIRRRWLSGRFDATWGGPGQWLVRRTSFERFLHDERYWHIWQPERITDWELRARMIELRAGVRYLTIGEVADRMYVTHNTVNGWIHKGYLPARKYGNWWIEESDLEAFVLPKIGGHRWKARSTNDE